jgi:hypothetical protein
VPDRKRVGGFGAGLADEDEWTGVGATKEKSGGINPFGAILGATENVEGLFRCRNPDSEGGASIGKERRAESGCGEKFCESIRRAGIGGGCEGYAGCDQCA